MQEEGIFAYSIFAAKKHFRLFGSCFRKHSLRLAPSIGRDFHIDEFGKLVFKHAWPASQVS